LFLLVGCLFARQEAYIYKSVRTAISF